MGYCGNQKVRTNFNPRAPCGARLMEVLIQLPSVPFQSTRPVRGATATEMACLVWFMISIHAPRAGRDQIQRLYENAAKISIHAPRAGRDVFS